MRRTCEECKVNLANRWYLGLSIYDDISNYLTWSQNYIRRYKESDVFNQIFDTILNQAIEYGFVDMETVFGDGTHQKVMTVIYGKNIKNRQMRIDTQNYGKTTIPFEKRQ